MVVYIILYQNGPGTKPDSRLIFPKIETWLIALCYCGCMEPKNKDDYYSFLLRLWRVENGEQKKRASLENVENGEKNGFASLEELLVYLAKLTNPWEETATEGKGSEVQEGGEFPAPHEPFEVY
jgi:hypothetical protein